MFKKKWCLKLLGKVWKIKWKSLIFDCITLSCTHILFTECSTQGNKTRKVEQMVISTILSMELFLPLGKEISDKHSNNELCMVGE